MKKCKYCQSEFVCWNAWHMAFWSTWICNMKYKKGLNKLKFWRYFSRWNSECWNCGRTESMFFKVRNGIPYEKLKKDFIFLPEHELRGLIEEVNYLFYHGFKMWHREQVEVRTHNACEAIKKILLARLDTFEGKVGIDMLIESWEKDGTLKKLQKPNITLMDREN